MEGLEQLKQEGREKFYRMTGGDKKLLDTLIDRAYEAGRESERKRILTTANQKLIARNLPPDCVGAHVAHEYIYELQQALSTPDQ